MANLFWNALMLQILSYRCDLMPPLSLAVYFIGRVLLPFPVGGEITCEGLSWRQGLSLLCFDLESQQVGVHFPRIVQTLQEAVLLLGWLKVIGQQTYTGMDQAADPNLLRILANRECVGSTPSLSFTDCFILFLELFKNQKVLLTWGLRTQGQGPIGLPGHSRLNSV